MMSTGKMHELIFFSLIYLKFASSEIIPITEPLDLSEGPHWDHDVKALYFVNIYFGEIHRYLPEVDLHTSAVVGTKNHTKPVTFIVPVKNRFNTFLIGYGGDLATVEWDGVSDRTENLEILSTLEENFPTVRMNDGKVSPSGVVFAGSMAEEVNGSFPTTHIGHLFTYDPATLTSKVLLENIGIGNGLAWNSDETVFYYIDSLTGEVKAYDYDSENISLSNERIIFDFCNIGVCPPKLFPDGMAIDVFGNLWVALNNEGKVYNIDARAPGVILNEIDFYPITPLTSVAFGGSNLEDLYVTSMRHDLSEEEKEQQPNAGCLFKVTGLNTEGLNGVGVNLS